MCCMSPDVVKIPYNFNVYKTIYLMECLVFQHVYEYLFTYSVVRSTSTFLFYNVNQGWNFVHIVIRIRVQAKNNIGVHENFEVELQIFLVNFDIF